MIKIFKKNTSETPFKRNEISRKTQLKNISYIGQSFWYILTIAIYLGCTFLGFLIAYFIVKILIEMKLN